MKKILYSLFIFASATLFAQKNPNVKFAVSGDMIGTVAMFESQKDFVQSTQVYKTAASLPQKLKKFSFLADQGLTEVKFKNNVSPFDNISLASFNQQSNLPKDTPVFIEGYEFKDTNMRVFSEIAQNLEVKDYNGVKTLFITSTRK
ncbi:hypothetical protein BA768_20240 [Chryseobacterium sp. CBo1]|uniref:hypothetical protein n=1 Tax=Chryseobacterium sp. CBo1 TaxID=1869230 RepID=UPI000810689D|nr:hypothetical protein [Chryseobacterium sp. CBo1]OCK50324.1 hypothetical protein BA768_20240 [Chryseobacterium sp. CBo1]